MININYNIYYVLLDSPGNYYNILVILEKNRNNKQHNYRNDTNKHNKLYIKTFKTFNYFIFFHFRTHLCNILYTRC